MKANNEISNREILVWATWGAFLFFWPCIPLVLCGWAYVWLNDFEKKLG